MSLKLIGKKKGMVQIFDESGNVVVCTAIQAEPNFVAQVKTKEKDGYCALQIAGVKNRSDKNVSKPLLGHFKKGNIPACQRLSESRLDDVSNYALGQEINVSIFQVGDYVDVIGISKGKGYQGVMKLYGFSGGPASHGSGFHRHAGSTGMRSTPGRSLPGSPRPCHMGVDRVSQQGLKIISVDVEKNLILVRGSIPGHRESIVYIAPAIKKIIKKK